MKPKSTLRTFLSLAGSSLLAVTCASAGTYYWDSDGDGTVGFGSAAGIWSSAGTGNLWSTDSEGNAGAVADYATTTADDLFFGNAYSTDVAPLYQYTGVITIDGTVNANSIFCSSSNPSFVAGTSPVINFPAEGRFEHATEGTIVLPALTITGAGTSMTWKAGFIDNLSLVNITNNAGKNIIEGKGCFIAVGGGAGNELGPDGTPFVFNGGGLRMTDPFYSSMSAFNVAHPITINSNVDIGFDPRGSLIFTVDMALNLGTGGMYIGGTGTSAVVMTVPQNHTGGNFLTAGYLQVSDNSQLGDITSPLCFGSGPTGTGEGGNGSLRVTGTTMTDLGARPMIFTDNKAVAFDIADAANTFTLDKVLPSNMPTGTSLAFQKRGAGTLVLTEANVYTGKTEILVGTLLINGNQSAATGLVDVRTGSRLGGTGTHGGSVTVENTSGLTFDLSGAKLNISGNLTFEHATGCVLDLTDSGSASPGTYTVATVTGTISANLPVVGTVPAGFAASAPYVDGNDLKVDISPAGSAYDAWATGSEPFDGDANDDGVMDGLAFLLGAATPSEDARGRLPTVSETGGGLVLQFNCLPIGDRGTSVLKLQHSSDLGVLDTWVGPEVPDADGSVSGVTFVVDTISVAPLNKITATIGVGEAFGGKLFGRLNGENP